MYYSWMGLCSGHENSVVIRELSLYPQSLSAKLTVSNVSSHDVVVKINTTDFYDSLLLVSIH